MVDFRHELGALEPWIHDYGVVAVFVILTLESLGIPLPGESLLIVAAILAGRGDISFPGLLVAAWAGSVLGDNIGYLIGRMLGRRLVLRYGAKIGLTPERLRRVEAVFAQYGPVTVAFARFVNLLRQLNGVVAGTVNMEWRRFMAFNALGGALWVLAWTMAGFYLSRHGARIDELLHKLGYLGALFAAIALVLILTYFFGHHVFTRLRGDRNGKTRDCGTPKDPGKPQDQA
jgi:membrane protein DedA with SNARE-associated domain